MSEIALFRFSGPSSGRMRNAQLELFPRFVTSALQHHQASIRDLTRLHDRDLLSFDPTTDEPLAPEQVAELRFLAGLVDAGCDYPVLVHLLRDLERPYAYEPDLMVYNFAAGTWQVVHRVDASIAAEAAIEAAVDDEDDELLQTIGQDVLRGLVQIIGEAKDDEDED